MRRTRSRWIAATSTVLLLAGAVPAARRPRYGGELRVEMRAQLQSPDPGQESAAPVLSQVFETLVRIDERGEIQPWLATSWTHDAAAKRWVFVPRTDVTLHNGSLWTPPGGTISVPDEKPIEQILRDLAKPANAIVVRDPNGTLLGTGPFHIVRWEPGKTARLEAHDGYWRGRPFLDAVEIQMGRGTHEQLLDLELAKIDVAEAEVTDVRHLRQRGVEVQISKPSDTLALVFENSRVPEATREALALAIDRGAMQRVLLDRQGEISAALLPQWLSGYAFLFPAVRDLARARTLAHGQQPLRFVYDRDNTFLRSVAERIAVDAGEAGITLSLVNGAADVRMRRLPLMSINAEQALEDFTSMLGLPSPHGSSPYDTERQLLADFHVIPLFHLPAVYGLQKNVRNWTPGWRLDDVWLEAR